MNPHTIEPLLDEALKVLERLVYEAENLRGSLNDDISSDGEEEITPAQCIIDACNLVARIKEAKLPKEQGRIAKALRLSTPEQMAVLLAALGGSHNDTSECPCDKAECSIQYATKHNIAWACQKKRELNDAVDAVLGKGE
jgi:hypothetical protein